MRQNKKQRKSGLLSRKKDQLSQELKIVRKNGKLLLKNREYLLYIVNIQLRQRKTNKVAQYFMNISNQLRNGLDA